MMVGITVPLVMGRWRRRARYGDDTRTCHAPALAISQHAHERCRTSLGPESTKRSPHRMSTGLIRVDTRNVNHTIGVEEPTRTIDDWRLEGWTSIACSRSTDDRTKRLKCHDRPEP